MRFNDHNTYVNHYTREAEERQQKHREEFEHVRRLNAAVYGRPMSKKEQYETYGNYVEPVPHPESPHIIAKWNAGRKAVFCPLEYGKSISPYIYNGECRACATPCANHARNTAKRELAPEWEEYFTKQ